MEITYRRKLPLHWLLFSRAGVRLFCLTNALKVFLTQFILNFHKPIGFLKPYGFMSLAFIPAMFAFNPAMFAFNPAMFASHPVMFAFNPAMFASHPAMFAFIPAMFASHLAMFAFNPAIFTNFVTGVSFASCFFLFVQLISVILSRRFYFKIPKFTKNDFFSNLFQRYNDSF